MNILQIHDIVICLTLLRCLSDFDECGSNPCQNGGTCVDGLNQYTCSCQAGYTGTSCQTGQTVSYHVGVTRRDMFVICAFFHHELFFVQPIVNKALFTSKINNTKTTTTKSEEKIVCTLNPGNCPWLNNTDTVLHCEL